jgi:PKD repeat protein
MKKLVFLMAANLATGFSSAQVIIDSCFSSPVIGTSFTSTVDLANAYDADLINWDGSVWQGGFSFANLTVPPPCTGPDQRAVFMGDSIQWTSGGEGIGLRLDVPLVAGQTYSFTFTYVSDGLYSNGSFSPTFLTNNVPLYNGAYLNGYLAPAGTSWTTSTFTFTATAAQNNHNWLLLFSNLGSGLLLNRCSSNLLNVSLGSDTTICTGDSVLIDAGNGFNGYLWSNGDTTRSFYAADSGTYIVTVSSFCGTASDTIVVHSVACIPGVAFAASDTSFCDKHCIDFTDLSGNNPTSWQWFFPGADSTTSNVQNPVGICYNSYGSFDVTLVACNVSGCDTLSVPAFIKEFQPPAIPIITSNADTLFSTQAYSYQWFDSAGAIAGANGSYYIYQQPGYYYVIVTDSNGCASSSVIIGTGIEDITLPGEVKIIPNPSDGKFDMLFPGGIKESTIIEILDVQGRMIKRFTCEPGITKLMLDPGISSDGLYFLQMISGNQCIVRKIIISNVSH